MYAEEPDGGTETYFDGWYQTADSDAAGQQSWQQRSRSIGYFDGSFGDQLEGNARAFYQALASADMTQHTSSENGLSVPAETEYTFSFASNGGNFSDELSSNGAEPYEPVREEIALDVQKAIDAFKRDCQSNAYWIWGTSYGWSISGSKTSSTWTCRIKEISFWVSPYYEGILNERAAVESALAQAVSAVQERAEDTSRYALIKAIHDYTAELVTYGNASQVIPYEHTVTGGLLDTYQHTGVCESYAKIVKLLCDRFSIPCVLMTGGSSTASDGSIVVDHMWNMVQMENGQWYLVDATWDDQASGVYTTYFLAGSESAGFNGKTVGQDHMAVGDFTGVGYEPFALPTLSADAYSADVEKEKPLTEIQLDQENLSLHHGESAVLSVTYLPTDSTEEKSVVWTTSDEEVATVNENGTVIAGDKAGTAEITAVSSVNEELTASCEVTVEHIEGEWEVVEEPTCTEAGSREKTCIRCMEVLDTEPVDALGHEAGEWEVVDEPTCTEAGSREKTCIRCMEVLDTEPVDALGHEAGEWEVVDEPTCTEAGSREKTCIRCMEVLDTEPVDALGHEAGEWEVVDEPTCTEAGSREKTCIRCMEVLDTEPVDALGHEAGEWEVVDEPTCTEAGSREKTCIRCEEPMGTEEIAALGHKAGEWEIVEEASCTEAGSRERRCTECDEVLDTEEIPAAGHQAGEWEIVEEASCTEAGSRERRCTECDEVLDTEEIPAAGHKAGAWEVTEEATCTESGEEEQSCEECGELLNTRKISATGHQFGSYQVVKKATVLAKGIKARTCTLCGKEQTVSLPKLTAQISTSKKTLKVKKGAKVSFPKVKYGQGDSIKSYKSNKPSIATVDKKGKITGVKPGTAVITVTLASKKKASVTVTVTNPTKKLSVNKKTFSLKEGKSAQLKVTVTPKDSSDKVVYKSSDEKVATVNQKGKITAKKKGTALITITSGSKKIVCRVTVKKK